MDFGLLVFAFIALAVLITALKSFRVVGQASVMIIERLGKFHKMANSGLNIILPFLDKPRSVYWSGVRPGLSTLDLREQLLEFAPQPVITRDNVTVNVDSVLNLLDLFVAEFAPTGSHPVTVVLQPPRCPAKKLWDRFSLARRGDCSPVDSPGILIPLRRRGVVRT